jgi:hypothetical protein
LVFKRVSLRSPSEQAQKDGLQYILGIRSIAGDPVGGAEYQNVVRPKGPLEFVGNRDCRFLSQKVVQGPPPTTKDGLRFELLQ